MLKKCLSEILSNCSLSTNLWTREDMALMFFLSFQWYLDADIATISSLFSRLTPSRSEGGRERCGRWRLRAAFRGGYHCRCREIGWKMGNPAAWWQMVDHRGRERAARSARRYYEDDDKGWGEYTAVIG